MNPVDVPSRAAELPDAWSPLVLARIGPTEVKVLRMDGRTVPVESHETAETLLVVDGTLRLTADGAEIEVRAGEMYVVEAGVEHAVRPGSRGTLVIVEHGSVERGSLAA
ncbi:cupin domain-containing protein [Streptomyces kanamyceticus]|uniref:Cupin domain-containing protein n=1 Tax=Streptomyces kanamyceticus TaxID=1967 RepID=A0A5J6GSQ8_STRKN|nr:cupin domain-containing protein [Streptomyces kanamyceticus]QEU96798.1 cupin domain-containing protein [Streptomyces kanamyceticus]